MRQSRTGEADRIATCTLECLQEGGQMNPGDVVRYVCGQCQIAFDLCVGMGGAMEGDGLDVGERDLEFASRLRALKMVVGLIVCDGEGLRALLLASLHDDGLGEEKAA